MEIHYNLVIDLDSVIRSMALQLCSFAIANWNDSETTSLEISAGTTTCDDGGWHVAFEVNGSTMRSDIHWESVFDAQMFEHRVFSIVKETISEVVEPNVKSSYTITTN